MSKLKLSAQEGRALIMALIVLAVGTLLIPPFLAYISTNLLASRVTEEGMKELYAADGGVERGIWDIMTEHYTITTTLTDVVLNKLPVTVTITLVDREVHLGDSEAVVQGGDLIVGPVGGRRGFVYVVDAITGTIEMTWMSADEGCPSSHDDPGWILALYEDAPIRLTSGVTPTTGCFENRFNPVDPEVGWPFSPITSTIAAYCPFTLTISAPNTAGIYSLLFYNGIDSCSKTLQNSLVSDDGSWLDYITTGVVTDSIYCITSTADSTLIISYVELFAGSGHSVEVIIGGITRTFGITPTIDIKSWQIGGLSP